MDQVHGIREKFRAALVEQFSDLGLRFVIGRVAKKFNLCSEGIQAKYDGKKMKNKDAGKNNDKGGRYEMGKRLQRKRANALKWQF